MRDDLCSHPSYKLDKHPDKVWWWLRQKCDRESVNEQVWTDDRRRTFNDPKSSPWASSGELKFHHNLIRFNQSFMQVLKIFKACVHRTNQNIATFAYIYQYNNYSTVVFTNSFFSNILYWSVPPINEILSRSLWKRFWHTS
jgi:hypothetical protein